MRLENKVTIVKGASRSIKAAVTRRFALEGAQVVLNYLNHAELAEEVIK